MNESKKMIKEYEKKKRGKVMEIKESEGKNDREKYISITKEKRNKKKKELICFIYKIIV